jgi:hypothetical protein
VNRPVNTVNMACVIVYLSQDDIGRLLGKDRTLVNVWRSRYDDFPAPDVRLGIGKRSVPGWLPERMDEIKAWARDKGLDGPVPRPGTSSTG